MYTAYWKLHERPFDDGAEARFYYPSEAHQAALLKLRYAAEHRCGAALVAGAPGLGKTRLVETLLRELPERYGPRVHLKFPQMPPAQLLALLAGELTGERSLEGTIDGSLHRIADLLAKNDKAGRRAIVVIDEAHLLRETSALETVRLLLNFQPAWLVLLAGQSDLLLALKRMPALEERFTVKCLLRRLALEETISYISHRMVAAGATDVHGIFDTAALEAVHRLSEGVPRRINRLCDLALLVGFAEGHSRICTPLVETVAEELLSGAPQTRQAA